MANTGERPEFTLEPESEELGVPLATFLRNSIHAGLIGELNASRLLPLLPMDSDASTALKVMETSLIRIRDENHLYQPELLAVPLRLAEDFPIGSDVKIRAPQEKSKWVDGKVDAIEQDALFIGTCSEVKFVAAPYYPGLFKAEDIAKLEKTGNGTGFTGAASYVIKLSFYDPRIEDPVVVRESGRRFNIRYRKHR